MRKKILALVLAAAALAGTACAEQPKAEEYRKVLSSGTYYVEYESDAMTKCLAVKDGKRMDYTIYRNMPGGWTSYIPVIGLFLGKSDKQPNAMYADGKYYQFQGKNKAFVATYDQLNDVNLDPKMAWSSVRQRLALPEELMVFAPNDEFNSFVETQIPTFVESGDYSAKKLFGGKDKYIYDKYVATYKTKSGEVLFEKIFYFAYKDGELKYISSLTKTPGGEEEFSGSIEVKKITAELPKGALEFSDKCKVYAAGVGDMNDLLDKDVLVEDYSKKKEAAVE